MGCMRGCIGCSLSPKSSFSPKSPVLSPKSKTLNPQLPTVDFGLRTVDFGHRTSLMPKLLFFNIPAYGHVNPTLPVVTELVKRGHSLVYYNAETFASAIKVTGAEFRAYPNSSTSEAELAKRVDNLVSVSV